VPFLILIFNTPA